MASSNSEPFFLSPIDNMMPMTAIPALLFFPIKAKDIGRAIKAFFDGLQATLQTIPLLTGTISAVSDGTQQGTLAITSPWRKAEDLFTVKDFRRNNKYSYSELKKKGFPPSAFPVWDFTSLEFIVNSNSPVMFVQATLIQGGLVLAPGIHHCFVDGTGHATILRLWAAFRRGERVKQENFSDQLRREPLLADLPTLSLEEFPEYTYLRKPVPVKQRPRNKHPSQITLPQSRGFFSILNQRAKDACYRVSTKFKILGIRLILKYQSSRVSTRLLHFPSSSLTRLKTSVAQRCIEPDAMTWTSTMDALSSLIFCCVTDSRDSTKLNPKSEKSDGYWEALIGRLSGIFQRPTTSSPLVSARMTTIMNARKMCQPSIPAEFLGNVLLWPQIQSQRRELTSSMEHVSDQARKLRGKIREVNSQSLKRTLGALRSAPDVSRVTMISALFRDGDLTISSWREQDTCFLDWGSDVGVRCDRVRICTTFLDGLMIACPEYDKAQPDDGTEVVLSLDKKVMEKLESNALFNEFAQWR